MLTEEVKNWNNYCGVSEDETPKNEMDFAVVRIIPLICIIVLLGLTTLVVMRVMTKFTEKVKSTRNNLRGDPEPGPKRIFKLGQKWANPQRLSGERLSGNNLSAEHAEDYSSQANDDSVDDFDENFMIDEKKTQENYAIDFITNSYDARETQSKLFS